MHSNMSNAMDLGKTLCLWRLWLSDPQYFGMFIIKVSALVGVCYLIMYDISF